MKINFQTKGIIISSRQKSVMERKIAKIKKYSKDEPMMVDLILQDDTSSEKGGIDQVVKISATFGKEKVFIEEKDDRLMRAFAFAYQRFERQMKRFHQKRIDGSKKPGESRLEKVFGIIKRKKNKNNAR